MVRADGPHREERMFHLYYSNRQETLADLLADLLKQAPSGPFIPDLVVIPHKEMGRWLSLELSRRLDLCANVHFPLPAGFIWQTLRQLFGDLSESDPFQPEVMQWQLFQLLTETRDDPRFAPLKHYVQSADEISRFELAGKIAACFDQYLVYRPDWIMRWEKGEGAVRGDEWQAALWRRLMDALPQKQHWVRLQQRLFEEAGGGKVNPQGLPRRVALFSVNALSPGYLAVLQLLSEWIDFHLFVFNPSEGHWFDLVDPARKSRLELDQADDADLHLEVGNPLLASLGGQGREFLQQLLDLDSGSLEVFLEPDGDSLLHSIQRDILTIRYPAEGDPLAIPADDISVQVHLCHGPMREVEVLHDQLLALFQRDEGLTPADVLVLTPDMDTYAPYIEAVFSQYQGNQYIPFSLSGGSLVAESATVRVLLNILSVPQGRYEVNGVLSLLEVPAIQRRFGIREDELSRLVHWVEESGIRWGKDPSTRRDLGLPETARNSWQEGLERMLLGYALSGREERMFGARLPFDDLEGSDGTLLGGLVEFTQALFDLDHLLAGRHGWKEWEWRLHRVIDQFFDPLEQDESHLQAVRRVIESIRECSGSAGFSGKPGLELVRSRLDSELARESGSGRFLGGGVTFCPMTPMRSLPFRAVCMIGMNDGVFPRERVAPGFDLVSSNPRIGDRSRRADDRYLFLETLISARDYLYISCVGQDDKDNSPIPPSTVVSELLDYLDSGYLSADGKAISGQLLIRHPLQPFSQRYFGDDPGLKSFSGEHCEGARSLAEGTAEARDFFTAPLPDPEPRWLQVELDGLLWFYANPVRYLFTRRLGIGYRLEEGVLESRDPFELGYFERSDLFLRLADQLLSGVSIEDAHRTESARGILPHGQVGEQVFGQLASRVLDAVERIEDIAPVRERNELSVDYRHGKMRLVGSLQDVGTDGLFSFSGERLPDSRLLQLWIRHLALNLAAGEEIHPQTRWLDGEGVFRLGPRTDARQRMNELLEIYLLGLKQPLHLFPKSSRAFAEQIMAGKDDEYALVKAAGRWNGGFKQFAESSDPYYQRAFGGSNPIDCAFAELSRRVYLPLLEAMETS
jgi:exodeoxyribonuclease V gamma subunit